MGNRLQHLAIIMDGNGRWAKRSGLSRTDGHKRGAEVVREITKYVARQTQIESLTLYAFSTENWKRPKLEVDFLMRLLGSYLESELNLYLDNSIRFKAIGDTTKLSKSLQKQIKKIEKMTEEGEKLTQYLALNYGSRDEIVRAANIVAKSSQEITQESLNSALDISVEIDLLIRTGSNKRLSNFLLWQASYAEFAFTQTLWPDFTTDELDGMIDEFRGVTRRFGGV